MFAAKQGFTVDGELQPDYNHVLYVGISNNYQRRMCQHFGPRGAFDPQFSVARCVVEVPYRMIALGVEQALIDMYGKRNGNNTNWDTHENPRKSARGEAPTLTNVRNAIYPRWRLVYCLARDFGYSWLLAHALGGPYGNHNVIWGENFPMRNCSAVADVAGTGGDDS